MPTEALATLRSGGTVGFLFTGGSSRCAFQIGVAEALEELGIRPFACLGVSAGAWNAAAVAVGSTARLRAYWRFFIRMPSVDVTNILRADRSPFIYRRMHERAFARYVGIDRLRATPVPVWIAVTRLPDREQRILDARTQEDPLQLLLASNYLPPFYTVPPLIEGVRCADGGIANNAPYEFLLENGCDRVVLIAPKGESEGGIFRNFTDFDHVIPDALSERVIVIRPKHHLPCGFADRDWHQLRRVADIGRARAREVLLGESHADLSEIRGSGFSPLLATAKFWRRFAPAS
ncbi:MAG TPA: patatin-like phospholipase family protein, partial [Thermoanaerobaculia bacterium]|nr:patatin-like phospholipase family protein [Thermoanaerobaculia bacterium]